MNNAKPNRYAFAEQLYSATDKTMQEIADLTGIPVRSLYRRAREYKWETLKRSTRRSPMILAEEMYRELSDLTATINQRPEGQRMPTPVEAELRRKILYSILAIKKFPTHAEAHFLLQGLIRYNDHFHFNGVEGLPSLIEGFLSHRDVYGFAAYQPEHNQDINQPTEQDLELLYSGPEEGEAPSPYRDPEDMILDKEQPRFHVIKTPTEDNSPAENTTAPFKPIVYETLNTPKPFIILNPHADKH